MAEVPVDAQVRLPIAALSILAFAQAGLVLLTGSGATRIIAVCLAIAGLNVRLPALSILAVLIVLNFGAHLAGLTAPFPHRLAYVSIFAMYGAVAIAGLAAIIPRVRFKPAFAVGAALAIAFVASETIIERRTLDPTLGLARVMWTGGSQPDPVLGEIYAPYAILRTAYPDNLRGYFDGHRPSRATPPSAVEYSVTYSLNALGCRGRDYPIPRPPGRHRILLLGGAGALGVGVHETDTLAARLERSLNAVPQESAGYDVINCAVNGYGTHEQRLFYEQIAFRYEPDVVLLAMTERDNLSRSDEEARGFVHDTGIVEDLLFTARLVQRARHEGRRPFDYSSAAEEILTLADACRPRGSRLAVVIFRNAELTSHWTELVTAVSTKLQGTDIPVLDLGVSLLKDHPARDLVVHPLDANPNEVAHRDAAQDIERLLRQSRLIG